MAFPFDYYGVIHGDARKQPDGKLFQRAFMQKAEEQLEKANATIEASADEIKFFRPKGVNTFWRYDAALLMSVPKGKFAIDKERDLVRYYLDFSKMVYLLSLGIWGLFGSFLFFIVRGSIVIRLVMLLLVWFIMICVNAYTGITRFKIFINRIKNQLPT